MRGRALRETLAALGVIASMVFVGTEIRQNTLQARAAAYQEIGHQAAEWYRSRLDNERLRNLEIDARYRRENLSSWTASDWMMMSYHHLDGLRLWQTLELQIEQGVLPPTAIDALGYGMTAAAYWADAAWVCFWPGFRQGVSASLRAKIEAAKPEAVFDCSHIDVGPILRGEVP